MSEPGPCGVRDHGRLLAEQLEREGIPCSRHWLERTAGTSLRAAMAQARAWAAALPAQIDATGAEAIVVHYSCFASAYRGVPLLAHPLAGALRRSRLPVVAVLHELFYPFGRDGARGVLWASTQRLALLELMRAVDAAIATTEERCELLERTRWLPRRPTAFAPVYSNLPAPSGAPGRGPGGSDRPTIGMFGFHYDGNGGALVLRALDLLDERGRGVQLMLIGSPGPDSRAGQAWSARAREQGVEHNLAFTGLLDPQPLSDMLASVQLLLFADQPGPTSRKGTLAGSLASGTPVLALDGPATWPELRRAEPLRIVPRDAEALAAGIEALLGDAGARTELGARGRAFAQEEMGVARTAATVRELLAALVRS
jgi:glycosyltransferase involved in cell wall biosynthesis